MRLSDTIERKDIGPMSTITKFLTIFFGTANARQLKRLQPTVCASE